MQARSSGKSSGTVSKASVLRISRMMYCWLCLREFAIRENHQAINRFITSGIMLRCFLTMPAAAIFAKGMPDAKRCEEGCDTFCDMIAILRYGWESITGCAALRICGAAQILAPSKYPAM